MSAFWAGAEAAAQVGAIVPFAATGMVTVPAPEPGTVQAEPMNAGAPGVPGAPWRAARAAADRSSVLRVPSLTSLVVIDSFLMSLPVIITVAVAADVATTVSATAQMRT